MPVLVALMWMEQWQLGGVYFVITAVSVQAEEFAGTKSSLKSTMGSPA